MGANLVSFQVDGREFIHLDPDILFSDAPHMRGCFHMFPSPCRLRNSRYTFQGREVHQQKRGVEYNIHGLVRDETFAITKRNRELIARLEWDEGHPVFEGFPWPGALELCYRIIPRGLEITFAFENRAGSPAPAGYGIHPFWRIPGERGEALVKVPADFILEAGDPVSLLPTGKLLPVDGTKYDLRTYRTLAGLFLDDVFYPRKPDQDAGVAFTAEGIQMRLQASPNMTHMICYSPEGQPFVCVENLTASPNAPNLYAEGFAQVSGLSIVPPGGKLSGWVRYTVEECAGNPLPGHADLQVRDSAACTVATVPDRGEGCALDLPVNSLPIAVETRHRLVAPELHDLRCTPGRPLPVSPEGEACRKLVTARPERSKQEELIVAVPVSSVDTMSGKKEAVGGEAIADGRDRLLLFAEVDDIEHEVVVAAVEVALHHRP
jgi:aldose 1-epimerase